VAVRCSQAGEATVTAHLSATELCETYDYVFLRDCGRPAVEVLMAGCVHEHVGPRPVCQFHIEDLAKEHVHCGDCRESSDPHECPLVVVPARAGGRLNNPLKEF
jgi:hypothetical protein